MESIINSICEAYIISQVIGIIGFIIIVKMIFNNNKL